MANDDNIIVLFIGSVAAVIIAFFIYNAMSSGKAKTYQPVVMPLMKLPAGSVSNPVGYYHDLKPVQPSVPYESIVQNEEKITWTDWLGRERVISISRVVH
jgi:hypothetical protein